jgi:hypothetical protein
MIDISYALDANINALYAAYQIPARKNNIDFPFIMTVGTVKT